MPCNRTKRWHGTMAPPIKDPRFETRDDPRFKRLPVKKRKIVLDERFDKIFDSVTPSIDPYGRKVRSKKYPADVKVLQNLYEFENNNSNAKKRKFIQQELCKHNIGKGDADPREISELTTNKSESEAVIDDRCSDHGTIRHQSSEKSSDDEVGWKSDEDSGFLWNQESDSSDDDEEEIADKDERKHENIWDSQDSNVPLGEETSRFAILGCEWESIKANDLFVLLNSFIKAPSGKINRIAIYLSDFGKERLEYEAIHGPMLELPKRVSIGEKATISETSYSKEEGEDNGMDCVDLDEEAHLQPPEVTEALRQFQKEKSRYYYAVVECDSVETSSSIYDQLDGTDASFSIDGLDLRYIPNEMPPFDNTFPRPPRDVATEASARGYEAPISFGSSLRHTRVKCTWDETPTHRTRLLRRKLSTKEMVEMDFNVSWLYGHGDSDYLAESGPDSGNEAEAVTIDDIELPKEIQRTTEEKKSQEINRDCVAEYRKMLLGDLISGLDESCESIEKNYISDVKGVNLEKEAMPKKLEGQFEFTVEGPEYEETESGTIGVWEQRLQKQKQKRVERRKERIAQMKRQKEDEENAVTGMHGKKNKKNKFPLIALVPSLPGFDENKRQEKIQPEILSLAREESDPMHADSDGDNDHDGKKKKGKRNRKFGKQQVNDCDEVKINFDDERFSAVFNDPQFAIDPTNPSFRNTKAYRDLLREKAKRKKRIS